MPGGGGTVCARPLCGASSERLYCSAECAAIEATRAWWDQKRPTAVMGHGAAVVHALDWMDVRVGKAS